MSKFSLRKSQKDQQRSIASERILILFREAELAALASDFELAKACVERALDIGVRTNVRMPRVFRARFCRDCHSYHIDGVNSRVRNDPKESATVVKCLECGSVEKFPYRKERRSEKSGR